MHQRGLAWIALALGALAPVVGCFNASQNGDPGAAFSSGTGSYPMASSSGYAGSRDGGAVTPTSPTEGTTHGRGAAGAGGASATDAGATDAVADGGGDARAADGGGSRPAACVVGATATFSLAWSLEDATGASATCAATSGVTVDVDVVNVATGAEALSTFPCGALAATTCAMPAGSYSVSMKLRDANGAVLSEIFAPTLFLVDGQATGVTSLPLQVGGDATKGRGFALTWSIAKLATGAIESCADTGAAKVRLLAGTTTFDLTCADGKGSTTAVAPGSYPVTLDLLDGTGAKLSETQTMTVAIAAGQLVFLGDVPFDVN
jgi:hypothetical protein